MKFLSGIVFTLAIAAAFALPTGPVAVTVAQPVLVAAKPAHHPEVLSLLSLIVNGAEDVLNDARTQAGSTLSIALAEAQAIVNKALADAKNQLKAGSDAAVKLVKADYTHLKHRALPVVLTVVKGVVKAVHTHELGLEINISSGPAKAKVQQVVNAAQIKINSLKNKVKLIIQNALNQARATVNAGLLAAQNVLLNGGNAAVSQVANIVVKAVHKAAPIVKQAVKTHAQNHGITKNTIVTVVEKATGKPVNPAHVQVKVQQLKANVKTAAAHLKTQVKVVVNAAFDKVKTNVNNAMNEAEKTLKTGVSSAVKVITTSVTKVVHTDVPIIVAAVKHVITNANKSVAAKPTLVAVPAVVAGPAVGVRVAAAPLAPVALNAHVAIKAL